MIQTHLIGALILSMMFFFMSLNSKTLEAKTRGTNPSRVLARTPSPMLSKAALEQRFIRYFSCSKAERSVLNAYDTPTDADLFAIAINWKHLSPSFKNAYERFMKNNTRSLSYLSPSGTIVVHYDVTGFDAVSTNDTMGYGKNSNWRIPSFQPNGIPDYIDAVAWAFDSSWAMEVNRFGFHYPYSTVLQDTLLLPFHVTVSQLPYNIYGYTWYEGNIAGRERGHASRCELRNNWRGWNLSKDLDYEDHPEKAINITAAHEFFHGVQYAMMWDVSSNIYLDYFPMSWIEGSAVLMEDRGFDEINDYVQYIDDFFYSPLKPMLDSTYDGYTEYKNILITAYLFQFASRQPSIDFIRTMYANNYQRPVPFYNNLCATAKSCNSTWQKVLGGFFSGSYFTGSRADKSYFLSDCNIFDEWNYRYDTKDSLSKVTKSVLPFAMQQFSVPLEQNDADSLYIFFEGSRGNQANQSWDVQAIVNAKNHNQSKRIACNPITPTSAELLVTDWKQCSDVVVIVTNCHPKATNNASVYFLSGETIQKDSIAWRDSLPNYLNATGTLALSQAFGLYGTASISNGTVSENQTQRLRQQELISQNIYYHLSIPPHWIVRKNLSLTIDIPESHIKTMLQEPTGSLQRLQIAFYDDSLKKWSLLKTEYQKNQSTHRFSTIVNRTGLYTLVRQQFSTVEVYPNPVQLHKHSALYLFGAPVEQCNIYSLNGTRIASLSPTATASPPVWNLHTTTGTIIAPGTYISMILFKNERENKRVQINKKILILP